MMTLMAERTQNSTGTTRDHLFSDDTDLKHPHEGEPKRFFDPKFKHYAVKIMPGTHYVTSRKDEMLITTLGSCVSACIRDVELGVGGMNHFMLPESDSGKWGGTSASMRYGNHAMETLFNDVLAMGGAKNRMEIKLFGGGHVLNSSNLIGEKNIMFVERYLKNEHMASCSEHLGGEQARKIIYFPKTGVVKMKLLPHAFDAQVLGDENKLRSNLNHQEIEGSVELF
ncbi:MAG: chemoreceptor glutamine deamidase CheD [Halopseudomonas aestusnigri]